MYLYYQSFLIVKGQVLWSVAGPIGKVNSSTTLILYGGTFSSLAGKLESLIELSALYQFEDSLSCIVDMFLEQNQSNRFFFEVRFS